MGGALSVPRAPSLERREQMLLVCETAATSPATTATTPQQQQPLHLYCVLCFRCQFFGFCFVLYSAFLLFSLLICASVDVAAAAAVAAVYVLLLPAERAAVSQRRTARLSVEISFGPLGRSSGRSSSMVGLIVVVAASLFDIVIRGAAVGSNLTSHRVAVKSSSSNICNIACPVKCYARL